MSSCWIICLKIQILTPSSSLSLSSCTFLSPFFTIASFFLFSLPLLSSFLSHFPLLLIFLCLLISTTTTSFFFLLLPSVCCSASLAGTLTSHLHYAATSCLLSLPFITFPLLLSLLLLHAHFPSLIFILFSNLHCLPVIFTLYSTNTCYSSFCSIHYLLYACDHHH